ncbi:PIG-L deacetylase family protein [Nocardia terpenica]|nr:PIG-L family deacetylase [Nocardia terpenica]
MIDWARHRVLVIAPHPDDEAIGCGGLLSRITHAGGRAFVLWMTIADIRDYSAAGLSTSDQRYHELRAAAEFWPLTGWHLARPGTDNLRLDTVARHDLVDLIERGDHSVTLSELRPTVVAIPDPTSYNQDHAAVAAAALTALRPGPGLYRHQPELVLTYEQVGDCWNGQSHTSTPTFFVELTPADLDRKIAGLRLHESQWRDHPHTRSETAIRGLAALRGAQTGVDSAEAYRCLRLRA